jgi:monoamine oxidase
MAYPGGKNANMNPESRNSSMEKFCKPSDKIHWYFLPRNV